MSARWGGSSSTGCRALSGKSSGPGAEELFLVGGRLPLARWTRRPQQSGLAVAGRGSSRTYGGRGSDSRAAASVALHSRVLALPHRRPSLARDRSYPRGIQVLSPAGPWRTHTILLGRFSGGGGTSGRSSTVVPVPLPHPRLDVPARARHLLPMSSAPRRLYALYPRKPYGQRISCPLPRSPALSAFLLLRFLTGPRRCPLFHRRAAQRQVWRPVVWCHHPAARRRRRVRPGGRADVAGRPPPGWTRSRFPAQTLFDCLYPRPHWYLRSDFREHLPDDAIVSPHHEVVRPGFPRCSHRCNL